MGESKIRALVLLSGGLDSQLAVCVLREQGIQVQGIVFESPFFGPEAARRAAEQMGIPLREMDFTAEILDILRAPRHGFGAGMNPCIDCHAAMLRKAGDNLAAMGGHFLGTGEVLNERPMSQNRRSLEIVANESGYPEMVLRPLSALLLPATRPEQMGWVDRSRLLAFNGRSRKPQMALARRYGLRNAPTPAGGCRLTEPGFVQRLRDLRGHEGIGDPAAIRLLRVGRHFRFLDGGKVVVGRDERENVLLRSLAGPSQLLLIVQDVPGPVALAPAGSSDEGIRLAASICVRYADHVSGRPVSVLVKGVGTEYRLAAEPAEPSVVEKFRV
jgi:hypothetical protein